MMSSTSNGASARQQEDSTFDQWFGASAPPQLRCWAIKLEDIDATCQFFHCRKTEELIKKLVACGIPLTASKDIVALVLSELAQREPPTITQKEESREEGSSPPLAIFWDLERMSLPQDASEVVEDLKGVLGQYGRLDQFRLYGALASSETVETNLQPSGCHFVDCLESAVVREGNDCPESDGIRERIMCDAMEFAFEHQDAATLVFVAGGTGSDYAYLFSKLKKRPQWRTVVVSRDAISLDCDIKIRWNDDETPQENINSLPESKMKQEQTCSEKENNERWSLSWRLGHVPLNDVELCQALSMIQKLPVSVADAIITEYDRVVEVEASISDHGARFFECAKRLLLLQEKSLRFEGEEEENINHLIALIYRGESFIESPSDDDLSGLRKRLEWSPQRPASRSAQPTSKVPPKSVNTAEIRDSCLTTTTLLAEEGKGAESGSVITPSTWTPASVIHLPGNLALYPESASFSDGGSRNNRDIVVKQEAHCDHAFSYDLSKEHSSKGMNTDAQQQDKTAFTGRGKTTDHPKNSDRVAGSAPTGEISDFEKDRNFQTKLESLPLEEYDPAIVHLKRLPSFVFDAVVTAYSHALPADADITRRRPMCASIANLFISIYRDSLSVGTPMEEDLTQAVNKRIEDLVKYGICSPEEVDKFVKCRLGLLPEKCALATLDELAQSKRSSIRHIGVHLTYIMKRVLHAEMKECVPRANDRDINEKDGFLARLSEKLESLPVDKNDRTISYLIENPSFVAEAMILAYETSVEDNADYARRRSYFHSISLLFNSLYQRSVSIGDPMGYNMTHMVEKRLEDLARLGFCSSREADELIRSKLRILPEKCALNVLWRLSRCQRNKRQNLGHFVVSQMKDVLNDELNYIERTNKRQRATDSSSCFDEPSGQQRWKSYQRSSW